jgi:hypothetical protein
MRRGSRGALARTSKDVDAAALFVLKPAKPDIFRSVKNSRLEEGRCQAVAFYVAFSSKLNPEYQSLAMFTYRWRPILEQSSGWGKS